MTYIYRIAYFLFIVVALSGCATGSGKLVVHSQTSVAIDLIGYDGLNEVRIFAGDVVPGSGQEIQTPYRGLALLVFAGGQQFPVIIGEKSFTLKIAGPDQPPSFGESGENDFFYKVLSGGDPPPGQYDFALLMIKAKNLLKSSQSVKTVKELTAKKKEYYEFVRKHYGSLKHSDMVRRLIAQYFMMHEYVDYHTKGAPATDIRDKYQKEVLNGVKSWLELKTYIPEQEMLNYCVSLYYDRSMVTLASQIIENFRDAAYCSGTETKPSGFPGDLRIIKKKGAKARKLDDLKGDKVIAYVSDDCSVSMVETVIKARKLAKQKKNMPVVVAPLQKLSDSHFAMARMVSNGNMYFIDDETWRKANLNEKIKLPSFVLRGDAR